MRSELLNGAVRVLKLTSAHAKRTLFSQAAHVIRMQNVSNRPSSFWHYEALRHERLVVQVVDGVRYAITCQGVSEVPR